jgi:hypothetical protein
MEYGFIVKDSNKSKQLDAERATEAIKETPSGVDQYPVNRRR